MYILFNVIYWQLQLLFQYRSDTWNTKTHPHTHTHLYFLALLMACYLLKQKCHEKWLKRMFSQSTPSTTAFKKGSMHTHRVFVFSMHYRWVNPCIKITWRSWSISPGSCSLSLTVGCCMLSISHHCVSQTSVYDL